MTLPSRTEAKALLEEWVENQNLRRHMLSVEAAMRAYARHYGEDEELWGLTGLLHDLDYEFLGVPRESRLDKALLACDELTGLILACAYVRPDKALASVKLRSVRRKWKDKAFTAAIDRDENMAYIEALGEPFEEHVQRVLTAMQEAAAELDLAGA